MNLETLVSRIQVPYPSARPLENQPGMVVVGVQPQNGFPGLVLVWDEADANPACSATNAMERVMLWVSESWHGFPVRQAVLVERDSDGSFDHAYPEWSSDPQLPPLIQWKPLRWAGAHPRSLEAFIGLFGDSAKKALEQVAVKVGPAKVWRN